MRVTMNRRRAQALVVLRLMLPALGARVVGTKAGVATVGASKREARLGALEKAGERNPADSILSLLVCCPVCCGPCLVPASFSLSGVGELPAEGVAAAPRRRDVVNNMGSTVAFFDADERLHIHCGGGVDVVLPSIDGLVMC
mgnify:CR=1 FL=1